MLCPVARIDTRGFWAWFRRSWAFVVIGLLVFISEIVSSFAQNLNSVESQTNPVSTITTDLRNMFLAGMKVWQAMARVKDVGDSTPETPISLLRNSLRSDPARKARFRGILDGFPPHQLRKYYACVTVLLRFHYNFVG